MITWLASYPRSGNTFFRTTLFNSFGLPTINRYNETKLFLAAKCTASVDNPESAIKKLRHLIDPYLLKTHHLPDNHDPAIYIVRDGRDSIVSYAWFVLMDIRKFKTHEISPELFQSTLRELILETRSPFGTWGENVINWTQRPNTTVIKFEDLIRSPLDQISSALNSLDIKYEKCDENALRSFTELHHEQPMYYRKGKIGSWRDDMIDEFHNLFWEKNGEAMRLMNYMDPPSTNG